MIASGAASRVELSRIPPIVSMIPVPICGCAWAILPLMRAGQARPSRSPDTPLCPVSPTRDSVEAEVNRVPGD